jgi:hypothetical protein
MRTSTTLLLVGGLATIALLAMSGGSSAPAPQPAPPPGPLPGPGPNPNPNIDVLRQELNRLLAQADVDPNSVNPDEMDVVAGELLVFGLVQESATLRAKAAEVRAKQAAGRGGLL